MHDDPIDRGLAAAFGASGSAPPRASVLRALQARCDSALGVHLDTDGVDDRPVVVTEDAKGLHDPAGRYRVLGEIGRGGMGVVYKGRDHDLGRDVAMKVLKDEYAERPDVLARFVEEAQIGGQLQHPGIVPVYELGMHAGERPYFAMKLVKGETLAAQLERRADAEQDRRRLLGVFEQVCQTMSYAHARGVVHRDLKPANVMIGAFGEVQVVDWGFAKVLPKRGAADGADEVAAAERSVIRTVRSRKEPGSQSVVGTVFGTPSYMPPEQALGEMERIDQRSDVFALGAILCEILTGEPPYRECDGDLVQQAATGALDGAFERLRKCGTDSTLVALCGRCLTKARRERPESATEVATGIGSYLTSVEERVRQAQVRAAEARYKHRMTLLAAAAGLAILMLGAGTWIWLDGEAQARRAVATRRVTTAMSEASVAFGQAEAAGLDLASWSSALASAEHLVSLARLGGVEPDTRREAEALLADVRDGNRAAVAEAEQRARDEELLARLETLRIPTDDDVRGPNLQRREWQRLDAEYGRAFAEYVGGASLFEQPVESVLALLRRGDVEAEIAESLDHWGLVRDGRGAGSAGPGTVRIRQLATVLDSEDPWRSRLRLLLPGASREGERLRALATEADFGALTAAGCLVLGEALWRAGEQDAAVDVLRRGQEAHPQDFDLCFRLALHLELLDEPQWREAAETYRIAHALRPEHDEVLHRQAMALEELGRLGDAERVFRRLVARAPANAHWMTHVAGVRREQGAHSEALELYESALEVDPEDPFVLKGLGNVLLELERTGDALRSYRRAVELEPRDPTLHNNLGFALAQQGEFDEASECYRRALALDPRLALAHRNLGTALREQGELEASAASYERALAVDPTYAEAHAGLAATLAARGEIDDAIASWERAVELNPHDAVTLVNLGAALHLRGRLDEALECFYRAAEIDPREPVTQHNIGIVLAKQGKLEEAVEAQRRAIELDAGLARAHFRLGDALRTLGRPDEAIESYRNALQVEPRNAQAHHMLGFVLGSRGNPGAALECYRRAIRIRPDYAPARIDLARTLAETGDFEGAIAAFEVAEELFSRADTDFARTWREYASKRIGALREAIELVDDIVVHHRRDPKTSREWGGVAGAARRQRRYRALVELTERILTSAPELIRGDPRGLYDSAIAAAWLAADAEVDPGERVRLRGLARTWLHQQAERWSRQVPEGGERATTARKLLRSALENAAFASVRGDRLEALPEAERTAWQRLWSSIEGHPPGEKR